VLAEAEERYPSNQIAQQFADVFNISPDERRTFLKFARVIEKLHRWEN